MERKLWLPIIMILMLGMLTACQSAGEALNSEGSIGSEAIDESSEKKTEEVADGSMSQLEKLSAWEDIEIPEHEILLVRRRSNMAWGYQDQGYFIDTDGCVYSFDLAKSPILADNGERLPFIECLKEIRESSDGEAVFDKEFVKQICAFGMDLSAEDEFYETHARCDYGQDTLYFYRPETNELLKCEGIGDIDYTPKNESAARIADLLKETIMRMAREAPVLE